MEKYLLTVEFRYSDAPKNPDDYTDKSNKVTIGVYDTFDDACKYGNELLENLESKFPIHTFPDGTKAKKDRFSRHGGPFGSKLDIVTDLAYLKTPFNFFAKITTLKYYNVDDTIKDVISATKRYAEYKRSMKDEQ